MSTDTVRPRSRFVSKFLRDKTAMASSLVLLVFVLAAVFAPLIAPQDPYDPMQIDLMDSEIPPLWQADRDPRFLLGTAPQGRDMLSTILHGTGISLAIVMLIVVIGFAEWPQYARTVRASVLGEKEKDYVDAARALGFGRGRIMFRHILPNTLSPILVISTVQIANAIILEAALSFLGLGMPVTRPSPGSLIRSGFEYIFSGSWWITIIPAIVLIVLIFTINLLGDWLRDALNPRLYREM